MERVRGVDVARGLAVLGMFAAHVGYAAPDVWSATGWLAVADGRSAALFALLAGVSIALASGGPEPVTGDVLALARRRLTARAAVLATIGYLLIALDTPVAVILPSYAVMFVLALPVLGARRRTLVTGAVVVLLIVPSALVAWRAQPWPTGEVTDLLGTGYYPALAWVGYLLAGMAAGRLPLGERSVQVRLLAVGASLAVLGYGLGTVCARLFTSVVPYLSLEPHSDTTPEMVGNAGVALAVLGAALLASRRTGGRAALRPVAATGAMPLTVYSAQVLAIAVLGPRVVFEQRTNGTLIAFTLATLVATTLWEALLGRGPLERAVRAVVRLMAPDYGLGPDRPRPGPAE